MSERIAGHECNAYCEPGKGLHRQVEHLWVTNPLTTLDGFLAQERGISWFTHFRPWQRFPIVDRQPAPEAKPQTLEQVRECLCAQERPEAVILLDRYDYRYVGAYLTTFLVPVEVPA